MSEETKEPSVEAIEETPEIDELDARLKALEDAEGAIDRAYSTGRAERASITQAAQLDAAEAVAMAGIAMEADLEADEAARITVIAEQSGDRAQIKAARKREREIRKKAKADHKAATKSAKQAYDAIRFSAPNTMGFMRVVQIIFAIHIAGVLVWLVLTSRDHMVYDVTTMMDWAMVILESVAFWMFINRYKVARPFVIGMAAFGLIVPAAYDVIMGQFNPFAIILNGAFYIFLIFYFIFSDRVKATLVNDFAKHDGDYDKDDFVINRKGWPFIRNLIIYFIIFSILGHWMEMGMCQFIIMGLVQGEYDPTNTMLWRDWLFPFPMEGAAVVIIALVLYPFYQWLKKKVKPRAFVYIISFLAGALLCSIIEFSMGLLVNADLQLWDYRDNFCNIMGQVCLQNTLAFGVVASIITWWVYPLMERWIARVPHDYMNIAFVVIAAFGALIWSLYIINPPGVDEANKNPSQAAQIREQEAAEAAAKEAAEQQNAIDAALELEKIMNESLRDNIESATILSDEEKAQALAKVDEIAEGVDAISAIVSAESSSASATAADAGSAASASAGAASPDASASAAAASTAASS